MSDIRILHLSDLHFGLNENTREYIREDRNAVLGKLRGKINSINKENPIDHIIVSGDIAWGGNEKEFVKAAHWFRKLLKELKFDSSKISFCLGNHDINRRTFVGLGLVKDMRSALSNKGSAHIKSMDSLYDYLSVQEHEYLFYEYNNFCEKLNIEPYEYFINNNIFETQYSYSAGYKDIDVSNKNIKDLENIRIVAFNTALMSYFEEKEYNNKYDMWLGLPQIKSLIEKNLLKADTHLTVALFHHPIRYLDQNETAEYEGREDAVNLLMKNVDIALCGHTETEGIVQPIKYNNGGHMVVSGATYYADNYKNSFAIYEFDEEKVLKDPKFYQYNYRTKNWDIPSHDDRYTYPKLIKNESNKITMEYKDSILELGKILQISEETKLKNWKCIFYSGNEFCTISLKRLCFKKNYDDNNNLKSINLSNKNHINRYIDLECFCEVTGKVKVNFSYSKPDAVDCLSGAHNYFLFLEKTYKDGKAKKIGIYDNNNNLIMHSPDVNWSGYKNLDKEKSTSDQFIKLQNYFNIKLSTTLTDDIKLQNTQKNVNILNEIINNKGIYKTTDKQFKLPTPNLELMKKSYSSELQYLSLNFLVRYVCFNFDDEIIKLGNGVFEIIGTVDKEDLKNKIDTYQEGDVRNIIFSEAYISIYLDNHSDYKRFKVLVEEFKLDKLQGELKALFDEKGDLSNSVFTSGIKINNLVFEMSSFAVDICKEQPQTEE